MKKNKVIKYNVVTLLLLIVILSSNVQNTFASHNLWQEWEPRLIDNPEKEWSIQFNMPLDQNTINKENIYIEDNKGNKFNEIKLILGEYNDTIHVIPFEPYEPERNYFLYITSSIKAQNGTSLKNGIIVPFKLLKTPTNKVIIDLDNEDLEKQFNVYIDGKIMYHPMQEQGFPNEIKEGKDIYTYIAMGAADSKNKNIPYNIPEDVIFKKTLRIYSYSIDNYSELYITNTNKTPLSNTDNIYLLSEETMFFSKENPYWLKKVSFPHPKIGKWGGIYALNAGQENKINGHIAAIYNNEGISWKDGVNWAFYIHTKSNEGTAWLNWLEIENLEDIKKEEIRVQAQHTIDTYSYRKRVLKNEWIYFTGDDRKIYKVKYDGSNKSQITGNETIYDFEVVGDWIYYILDGDKGSGIYRIKPDGTKKQQLEGEGTMDFAVQNGWIYYCIREERDSIYKMNLDGTNKIKITDDQSMSIKLDKEWIYYSNMDDNGGIYKIKTDGSQRQKLNNEDSHILEIRNGWIYYRVFGQFKYLYKITVDGNNKTTVESP